MGRKSLAEKENIEIRKMMKEVADKLYEIWQKINSALNDDDQCGDEYFKNHEA